MASEFRQHWMEIIAAMVGLIRQQEAVEAKARESIMQGHKEDNKENTLLKLKIASLQELLDFKEANIQLLQSSVEAKQREIADLKESKTMLQSLVRQPTFDKEFSERTECLQRLGSIQGEIQMLTDQYHLIEEEKTKQEKSMMQLRVLTRENVLSGPKDKGVQVEEVGATH